MIKIEYMGVKASVTQKIGDSTTVIVSVPGDVFE
jgi:hypothetical protein